MMAYFSVARPICGSSTLLCPVLLPTPIRRIFQAMHRYTNTYKDRQTDLHLHNNKNVVDCVYVGNVVKVHLLAADKLYSD